MENNKFINKALEVSGRIAANIYLDSISKGLMGTLPILMIGSLALLFGVFPFDPWLNFIQSTGIEKYFLAASTVTTSCLSIYASFLIGHRLAGHFKCDQIPAGLISIFAFFITTPLTEESALSMQFMGAQGLFGAMIAALIATRLYCFFMTKEKLKIHMPEGVPPMIANTFSALIPGILVGFIFIFVSFWFFVYFMGIIFTNGLFSNCYTFKCIGWKRLVISCITFSSNVFMVFWNPWFKCYFRGNHCGIFTNGNSKYGSICSWKGTS